LARPRRRVGSGGWRGVVLGPSLSREREPGPPPQASRRGIWSVVKVEGMCLCAFFGVVAAGEGKPAQKEAFAQASARRGAQRCARAEVLWWRAQRPRALFFLPPLVPLVVMCCFSVCAFWVVVVRQGKERKAPGRRPCRRALKSWGGGARRHWRGV
jgi:hypothetical protein